MKTTFFPLLLFAGCSFLAVASPAIAAESHIHPNAVVAPDGSGDFKSVRDAIDAAPQITHSGSNWVILVKPGTYRELVYVQREKRFISLVGESATNTILTFDLRAGMTGPDGKIIGTFHTPTLQIDADDFTMSDLTVENSAGNAGQALALRVDGDRVVLRRCRFIGYQDTIFLNRGRQFLDRCDIAGATDFIFGGATAYFDHCDIRCVGKGYITAASTPDFQPFGFVFSHCRISGDPGVLTYLGRPWRDYAQTIFLNTEMSEVVRPEGWDNWKKPYAEKVARYAEYQSVGPGANLKERVAWSRQLTAREAEGYRAEKVLGGMDEWKNFWE